MKYLKKLNEGQASIKQIKTAQILIKQRELLDKYLKSLGFESFGETWVYDGTYGNEWGYNELLDFEDMTYIEDSDFSDLSVLTLHLNDCKYVVSDDYLNDKMLKVIDLHNKLSSKNIKVDDFKKPNYNITQDGLGYSSLGKTIMYFNLSYKFDKVHDKRNNVFKKMND